MALENSEVVRKIIHVAAVLLIPVDMFNHELALYSFLFFGLLYVAVLLLHKMGVHTPILKRLIHLPSRDGEMDRFPNQPTYFFFSVLVLLAFAPSIVAYVGIYALAIGDTFATIFGRHFRGPRTLHGKTFAGSIGFFLSVLPAFYFALGFWHGLAVALIGAAIETSSHKYDNLLIPLATSAAAFAIL